VLAAFVFLAFHTLHAQSDTLKPVGQDVFQVAPTDTVLPVIRKKGFNPDPRTASLLSLACPGLGQVYNRKYWKIPILAAGFGTIVYFIRLNNQFYKEFRDAANLRAKGEEDPYLNVFPDITQLRIQREYYRRNRDLLVILTAGLYALNIVDAAVDAHMSSFSVADDLTAGIEITPPLMMAWQPVPGFELRLVKRF